MADFPLVRTRRQDAGVSWSRAVGRPGSCDGEIGVWDGGDLLERESHAGEGGCGGGEGGVGEGVFRVVASKRDLFREADMLSVQMVLGERSRGMVGREELSVMKKDALLVNCSRGPIVVEEALLECLQEGRIGGAALDVYDTEPLEMESEWRSTAWGTSGRSRVVLSPHMGYVERDTMHEWYELQAENVGRWLKGRKSWGRSCLLSHHFNDGNRH